MKTEMAVFEGADIRQVYDEETGVWWFSVVDIVQVLTQQPDYQTARKYWNKLKERLGREGSQLVTNCHQLKMLAADGKQRPTDVATAETLLRLVHPYLAPELNRSSSGWRRWAMSVCRRWLTLLCHLLRERIWKARREKRLSAKKIICRQVSQENKP